MTKRSSMKTEAHLAHYERIVKAAEIMTDAEKAQLAEWEAKHLGKGDLATSDWLGWDAIINRMSH